MITFERRGVRTNSWCSKTLSSACASLKCWSYKIVYKTFIDISERHHHYETLLSTGKNYCEFLSLELLGRFHDVERSVICSILLSIYYAREGGRVDPKSRRFSRASHQDRSPYLKSYLWIRRGLMLHTVCRVWKSHSWTSKYILSRFFQDIEQCVLPGWSQPRYSNCRGPR